MVALILGTPILEGADYSKLKNLAKDSALKGQAFSDKEQESALSFSINWRK